MDNQNEVADIDGNGILKVLSIDQHGMREQASVVLNHGYQSKEVSFTLTEEVQTISPPAIFALQGFSLTPKQFMRAGVSFTPLPSPRAYHIFDLQIDI